MSNEKLQIERSQLKNILDLLERAEYLLPDTDTRVIDFRQEAMNVRELLKSGKA